MSDTNVVVKIDIPLINVRLSKWGYRKITSMNKKTQLTTKSFEGLSESKLTDKITLGKLALVTSDVDIVHCICTCKLTV